MEPLKPVTLDTIAQGAVNELFQNEFSKVLENIADMNTDPQKVREISIKIRMHADAKRSQAQTEIAVQARLAPIQRVETRLFLGTHKGNFVAVEDDPQQKKLFDQEQPQAAPQPAAPAEPMRAIQGGKQ